MDCNVTGAMNRDRIRQITRIDNNSFSVVMEGGTGEHKVFAENVSEALQKAKQGRDKWEALHTEIAA